MKGKKCPSCGKFSYFCHKGEHYKGEYEIQEQKYFPWDYYYCTQCNFTFQKISDHIWISEKEEAKEYRKLLKAKLRCPNCKSWEIEKIDIEKVKCKQCGFVTDEYEAAKQGIKNNKRQLDERE